MTFSVNKLKKTNIQIEPVIRVTKGKPAILRPNVDYDNYIKEHSYNMNTWKT